MSAPSLHANSPALSKAWSPLAAGCALVFAFGLSHAPSVGSFRYCGGHAGRPAVRPPARCGRGK